MSDNIVQEIVNAGSTEDQPSPEQAPENINQEPNPTPESQDDSQFSSRFAALSRKEKYIQEQQAALKAQQEEAQKISELKERIKENPVSVLEHFGISLDDLITASLGEDAPEPTTDSQIEALRAEIEGFKTAQQKREEEDRKKQEEEYQNSINEAITAHQLKITDHLSQNADKYELITLQGAQDLVWEVTEAHYEANNGEILTPEQASDKVEAYLEEQVRKAMNLKRFGAKEPEAQEKVSAFVEQDKTTEKPKSQTLTSDFVQASAPSDKPHSIDIEESKRRAAAMLKWT